MSLLGIHHLTAVSANARRSVDFYTQVLGLRLVKKTVNFDDPEVYHLYFGDEVGTPGTLVTFFEWSRLPKGLWGIGTTHHLAFVVDSDEAQLKWKRLLLDHGTKVTGPYDHNYFRSIYFSDPDGLILEIATRGPGWTVDEPPVEPGRRLINPPAKLTRIGRDEETIASLVHAGPVERISPDIMLKGLHHITAISSDIGRTADFLTEILGMKLLKRTFNYDDPTAPHYYFAVGDGNPGSIITYFGYSHETMRPGRMGTGLTHHFALAVRDDEEQLKWREKLIKADIPVTPVMDRVYFKSIYFQDPDGHILEIATMGPGFLVDEKRERLGSSVMLPRWMEANRKEIEKTLAPIP